MEHTTLIERAATSYLIKREQMGALKAASHTVQTFGVAPSELSAHLASRGLLLKQTPSAKEEA